MKTIKITSVGDGAVGQANLLMALERPDFQYIYREYVPLIYETFRRELLIDGEEIEVTMVFTAGQEDYDRLRRLAYPVTDVVLILFSVISPASFENVTMKWLPEVNQFAPTTPCLLVGTKSDLRNCQTTLDVLARMGKKPVTLEEIYLVCKTYQIPYLETSACTGFGVEECFYEAVRTALKSQYDMEIHVPYSTNAFNIPRPNDTLRRFIVDKLVPASIKDNVSFGVSLGFDAKTIKLHKKTCSIRNLRWQLSKFFIETVDKMRTFPYRFIYKALRKCNLFSLAEELVECLNHDQDLMSVGLGGNIVHEKVDKTVKIALRKRLCSFSFCIEDQTPQSIWKMGSQAHSLYMEILKSGTERRYIIRIMIVGPFGVGKTCLLRRLLNKDIHDVISTNGIDICRCKVQISNERWIFDDDLYFDDGKERKSRLLRKMVTSQEYKKTEVYTAMESSKPNINETSVEVYTAKESSKPNINKTSVDFSSKLFSDSAEVKKASQDTISPRIGSKQDQPVVQKTKSKPNIMQSPHKDLLDDFQGIHDSDVSYEDLAEVRILDFAGQYEFYATHQTFLNKNAIYLLVLDMSKDLKGILPPDDLDESFKDITEIPFEDIGEYVNFWLDAIHCYTENAEEEQSKYSLPPIVVVGTCSDKVNDKKKRQVEIQDQLGQLLGDHPKGKHIQDFIFLSNTTSTESEYDLLRDNIIKLGSQLATWGQELPVRWIKLGEILHQLKESQTELISREEVIELGKDMDPAIHDEMEITLFLKYEHETGNVIYFDDISEFVILRPQWLIDVLKCLISPRKFKKKNVFVSNDWTELEQTGRLTDHLFTEVFNTIIVGEKSVLYKEHVLKVLEKFDIIVKPCCIVDNSAQQTLYTEIDPIYMNITLENKCPSTETDPIYMNITLENKCPSTETDPIYMNITWENKCPITETDPIYMNIAWENKCPITGSSVILQNTTSPVHEDQAKTSRVRPSDVIVGNIQESISKPHISSEYSELRKDGYEVQGEIGQVSHATSSLQNITSPEITEVHAGGIEVEDEIGQVSRDTSSLQDITSPGITVVHEGDIEVHDEIGQVSRDTSSLQDITSPEITEVHEGAIEVEDEIGQVSHDTSSLQDITSPEITEVHEGGIEVQDEISQVSRDTSSLRGITSPGITEVHEGGIEVPDEIGQVSRDTSSLQVITSPEITEVHEGDIEVDDEICEVTHETCSLHSIRSQDNVDVQDDGSEVQNDINLVTHATLVEHPSNSPMKCVSEQQKQPLHTLEDMNIHNDSTTRRSTNDGIEAGRLNKKTGDNYKKPRNEHLSFQKQTTESLDYYVPCLIKAKPIKNVQENFKIEGINCQRTSWVCMDFDFLPPAFFNHVLVGYIRRYQISREPSKRGNRLALYRGMCVFNLDTSGCTKLAVCVYGKVIQFQIWDWRENVVKSYKQVWENAVDFIAEIKRRYKIQVSYTIKMKCCDGSYDNQDGMVDVSKLQKDEQYFCDEHAITHNSKDLMDDWFKDGLSMEMLNYVRIATTITKLVRDSTCSMLERHTETLNLKCDPSFADVYSTFRQKARILSRCVDQEHSSWPEDVEKCWLIVKELRQLSQPVLNTDQYQRFSHELHCILSRFDKSLQQKHYLEKFLKISTECFGQEQYDSSVQAIFKDKIIDDVEVCITRHSERLIHEVQLCGILDYMMSQCAISTGDRKDIEHHPRPSEQNRTLLALIPKRGQVVFEIFIKALSYCQYSDLAELLVLDKEPDTTTTQTGESNESTELQSWTNVWPSKVRLQKNYIDIITTLKHDMITDHLISKEILTLDDMQVIEASPAQSDKNRKLLEILLQGAKNGLDDFLVALRLDDVYTDLAEQIEKTNVEPAEIIRLQNCF